MNRVEKQRFWLVWTILISIGCFQLLFRLTHINALLPFPGSESISLLLLDLLFVAFLPLWPAYLRVENQVQDLRRQTIISLLQTAGAFLPISYLVLMAMALVRGSQLWSVEVCVMTVALIWFGFKAIPQLRRLPYELRPYARPILAANSTIFFIIGSHLLYWGYPSTDNFGLHVNSFEQIVALVEQERIQLEPFPRQLAEEGKQFFVSLPRRYQYLSPCGTVFTQETAGARTLTFCQSGSPDATSSFLYRSDKQDVSVTPDEYQRLKEASPNLSGPWYLSRTKLRDHWFWEVEAW